jgi:predicted patatin/cPLA2 family phospholipase
MRGVVSAGMVGALEDLGALEIFDAIYGSSAGAFNGAYLISRRARLGTSIYYDDANNDGFINVSRALPGGGPILCLDFMLDHIAEEIKPLAWDAIIASPIPLHPIAASQKLERSVDLAGFTSKDELKRALRATATIPWVAGPAVAIDGDKFLDAAVFEAIPFRTAREQGATHVLALRTRPEGVLRGRPGFMERQVIARLLRREVPNLVHHYLARAEQYKRDIEELDTAPDLLSVVLPAGSPVVSQLEKDHDRLLEGAMGGFKAVYRLINGREPDLVGDELRGSFV